MSTRKISRREMLKGLGLAAVGTALAGCAPKVVEKTVVVEKPVEKVVKETVIVEGTPQVVERVVTATPPPQEMPKVYMYQAHPACGLDGSNPERLAAVRQLIMDETGIEPIAILKPPGNAGIEKQNMLIASGTQEFDLFADHWWKYKGVILPLDDLLAQYGQNILRMNEPIAWATMKDWEGVTWGYPRLGLMSHTYPAWFRSDWLEEAGLDVPTNWEEMENAIEAFREIHPECKVATNSLTSLKYITLGGWTEYGNSRWVDPADGRIKPPELQPGFKDWVARMNDWWNKDWWHKESFAGIDFHEYLKTLEMGVYLGWYSRITIWWDGIRQDLGLEKENYVENNAMKGPKGWLRTVNAGSTSSYMITRKAKHPDAVMRFVNWSYDGLPEDATNVITCYHGVEGTDWKWYDKSKNMAQLLITECGKKYAGDYIMARGMGTEPYYLTCDAEGNVTWQRRHTIKYWNDHGTGKMPVDYDVPYDMNRIQEKCPQYEDVNRLLNEEVIKFITGLRPLTEWDTFLKELDQAGLDAWSDAYTEQYRRYHPE